MHARGFDVNAGMFCVALEPRSWRPVSSPARATGRMDHEFKINKLSRLKSLAMQLHMILTCAYAVARLFQFFRMRSSY